MSITSGGNVRWFVESMGGGPYEAVVCLGLEVDELCGILSAGQLFAGVHKGKGSGVPKSEEKQEKADLVIASQ